MPQGDKSAYTDKQKRKAAHIEDSYKERGVSQDVAEARAWATVNKEDGGGKLSGSGRAPAQSRDSSGNAGPSNEARSRAAKKGWETRRKAA